MSDLRDKMQIGGHYSGEAVQGPVLVDGGAGHDEWGYGATPICSTHSTYSCTACAWQWAHALQNKSFSPAASSQVNPESGNTLDKL